MVPKLHAKGTSFKGAARYLLHDKGKATSNDRVAWTSCRNLVVDDPDLAWRIMAATAIDQGRLKAQAGVKNTGRKSAKHVLHLTLNWHPDQNPTQEQMQEAADEALKALGAQDHQALIVAHDDTPHAHCHILLNRVSPIDGRHLSSSNEKLNLSKWAEAYEERDGHIFCKNRRANNARRDRGDYTRGSKDQARHIFEQQRKLTSNDNDRALAMAQAQREADHALALRGRDLAQHQSDQFAALHTEYYQRRLAMVRAYSREKEAVCTAVFEDMRADIIALEDRQAQEAETFVAMEQNFFGRMQNAFKSMTRPDDDLGPRKSFVARSFGVITNQTTRLNAFLASQAAEKAALEKLEKTRIAERMKPVRAAFQADLTSHRQGFLVRREALVSRHQNQNDQLKEAWKMRTRDRHAAYQAEADRQHRENQALQKTFSPRAKRILERYLGGEFNKAKTPEQDNKPDKGDDIDR